MGAFGSAEDEGQGPNLDEYREAASRVATVVGEKASVLKGQAMDWFSQFAK